MKRTDKKWTIRRVLPGVSTVAALAAFWFAAGAPPMAMF